jgi:transposase
MSMRPMRKSGVPEATAQLARTVFPKGNIYMAMHDELGDLYEDEQFADLFGVRGNPAEAPWRLALLTIIQFVEDLTDVQAAEAVRSRIDVKYALELELEDTGFDASVLCKFRRRLVSGSAEERLLDMMLEQFKAKKLLKGRGKQRSDSTHVVAAIRSLSQIECVGETLRHALNALATVVPDWLRACVPLEWFDRYGIRIELTRLPTAQAEREALVLQMGADGYQLMTWVYATDAPGWLRELPAVEILRQVWVQQFHLDQGQVRWRAQADLPPCAQQILSPYDPEARFGKKRTTEWVGYKAHLTETCDDDLPHFITHVETTLATTDDACVTETIHTALAARDLLPDQQLLDAGYMSAEHLVTLLTEYGVDLVGPVLADNSWQAQAGLGFDKASFEFDWDAQSATCPCGYRCQHWSETQDQRGIPVIYVRFDPGDCQACEAKAHCTTASRRTLKLRPEAQHKALQQARQRQDTEEFKVLYRRRAGSEGTIAQFVGALDGRRARYWSLAKVHLQQVVSAAAINLIRWFAWFEEIPRARTRTSRFASIAA